MIKWFRQQRAGRKLKMIGSTYRPLNVDDLESTKMILCGDATMGQVQPGTFGDIDLKLDDDMLILGGQLILNNATFGDYASISLVDKDGYMYPTNTEIAMFVKRWFPQSRGNSMLSITVPVPAKLPGRLWLRVRYHSVATTGEPVGIAVNYTLYKILV